VYVEEEPFKAPTTVRVKEEPRNERKEAHASAPVVFRPPQTKTAGPPSTVFNGDASVPTTKSVIVAQRFVSSIKIC
jgi:hypothetical protein